MGITPSGLLNRPVVHRDDTKYLDGYRFLTRSRAHGEAGPLPIAVSEVQAYLMLIEEDRVEERLRFLRYVQEMDGAYLDHAVQVAESRK
jgi:hypothetical protein